LEDYNKASWFENFIASIAGASASLVVSAPLDVIKTRIQNRNFDNPEGGFRILSNMARKEGASSFFKGLVPKVGVDFVALGICRSTNARKAAHDRT
jgi:transmembrane carrier protein